MDFFNQAIEINPKFDEALFNRGRCYYKMGAFKNAISDYNRALEVNPKNLPIYFNKGLCLIELKDYKEALTSFLKIDSLEYNNPNLTLQKANCYLKIGSYQKAANNYSKALSHFKDSISIYLLRGSSYFQLGQYDKALSDLEFYIPFVENPKIALEYAAISRFKIQDYLGSITYFDKMIENGAVLVGKNLITMADALVFSAQKNIKEGDRDKALELLTRATTLEPLNKNAFFYRGLLFLDMGRKADACLDLNMALINGETKALKALNYSCPEF